MKRILLCCISLLLLAQPAMAQDRFEIIHGDLLRSAGSRPGKGPDGREVFFAPQPTPSQTLFDVIHYDVDIAVDHTTTLVEGRISILIESLVDSLYQVDINADVVLTILSVDVEGSGAVPFTRDGDVVSIYPAEGVPLGERIELVILYEGDPTGAIDTGLFFRTHDGAPVAYSLSEPWSARTWWPCKDYPDDKATFDIALAVRPPLFAASNGEFIGQSDTTHWAATFTRYRWKENYPMAPYLFSISAAEYVLLTDQFVQAPGETLQITNYVYPDKVAAATEDLNITIPALEFFSDLYGPYPYPGEKYGVALCEIGGGMEHQTLCSYGGGFIRGDHHYDWLWIHELAHQWFGDLVTCRDWTHIWLNEGWASYSEALWEEHIGGTAELHSTMSGKDQPEYWSGPILRSPYVDDQWYYFNSVVYSKAAWVLHMLRHIMGDVQFFQAARDILADPSFSYGNLDTDQFVEFFEGYYGNDLNWFFDPWLTREDRLTYEWSWSSWEMDGTDYLSILVGQAVAEPYTMPADFRIETTAGTVDTVLWIDEMEEAFLIPVPGDVLGVIFDPDHWILCDLVPGVTGEDPEIPVPFLSQNFPNPFNPSTTIQFGLESPGYVLLQVFDPRGVLIATLADGTMDEGRHEVRWNGTNDPGRPVSSGVYFYRLRAGGSVITKKMLLLR
jgi:aminopeptidase N